MLLHRQATTAWVEAAAAGWGRELNQLGSAGVICCKVSCYCYCNLLMFVSAHNHFPDPVFTAPSSCSHYPLHQVPHPHSCDEAPSSMTTLSLPQTPASPLLPFVVLLVILPNFVPARILYFVSYSPPVPTSCSPPFPLSSLLHPQPPANPPCPPPLPPFVSHYLAPFPLLFLPF